MEEQNQELQLVLPEYNILLLGETGAGKSTTINAFANYLKYQTFEEAKTEEFVELISSKFTIPHPKTGKPIVIRSGNDDNERQAAGTSSTQSPIAYSFQFEDKLLRIIDTPGMGDTSGVNIDRENFDKILAYLHNYKELHGICFLIKATETRKTAFFRYCITELLTHLHKSACENIIFCFTFSRSSFYGPGDGFSTVKSFLDDDLREVQLKLQPKINCFFIDNEAFRFLVAQKQGFPFAAKQVDDYEQSWRNSVEQSTAMWSYIRSRKPHDLKNTVSLNNARKLILELAEPMVQLQNNITANILHIQNEEDRIKNSNDSKQKIANNLNLDVDDLEMTPLSYPRTVCTASKCTEVVTYQGQTKVNYKTHCHPHCYLSGVTVKSVGDPILRGCAAMSGRENCQVGNCGCPWNVHMHIMCEFNKVKRSILDSNKQKEITSIDDAIRQIEAALRQMKLTVAEYEDEYKVIQEVCSKFAYILIVHSNTPYNRFIEPYLDLLIDEESKKIRAIPGYSKDALNSLKKMKESHQQSVKILTNAIKTKSHQEVAINDIYKFRDQLFNLKHSGPQFRQILNAAKWAKENEFKMMKEQKLDFSGYLKNKFKKSFSKGSKNLNSTPKAGPSGQEKTFPKSESSGGFQKKAASETKNVKKPAVVKSNDVCFLCKGGHKSTECDEHSLVIRNSIVNIKDLCSLCLTPGHGVAKCTSEYLCTKCKGKHAAAICQK